MADRYFKATSNSNWSDTANWSTTSGGAGGASVPTSSDDVYFSPTSDEFPTCTIDTASTCRNLTTSGNTFGGNSFLEGTSTLDIYGSLTLVDVYVNYSGTMTFRSTGSETITTNGTTINAAMYFNAAGGTWTLQDNLDVTTKDIYVIQGTLNTNGKTVTCDDFAASFASAYTRAATLGASVINCRRWLCSVSTNFTLSATSATINLSGSTTQFDGGGLTYGTVSITMTGQITLLSGTNTFTTLTVTNTATTIASLSVYNNQTISGTLTIAGNSLTNRILVYTSTRGTAMTLTAATTTLSNVDFMDITAAGAGSWSGTSIGNALGNTGITFTTPVTRYGVAAGNWSSTATWSATSGGSAGASVPLCHDTVILNASSGSGTYVSDLPRAGASLTCTGFTGTYNFGTTISWFGSVTFASGMTITGTLNFLALYGRSSHTITSAGKTLPFRMGLYAVGGTYTLQDDLTLSNTTTGYLIIHNGTFDANNHNLSVRQVISSSGGTRAITMGSGTWTITTSGTVWQVASDVTINAGTSNIVLSDASTTTKAFIGVGKTYYDLTFSGAGVCTYTLDSSMTFNKIASTKTVAHTVQFTAGTTTTVSDFDLTGTSGNLITLTSSTTAAFNLIKSGGGKISTDYLTVEHCVAAPSLTWYAGANSVNNQSIATVGSGWYFHAPDFTNPGNIYSSNDVYATLPATSGVLYAQISKDAGVNWSAPLSITLTGSETTQTFGVGSTETWGFSMTRADLVDASFRIRLYHDGYQQTYKTFGFTTGTDIITGLEVAVEGYYSASVIYLDHLKIRSYYGTSVIPVQQGSMAYASNGRKNGEGVGSGTGVLVFYDGTNWIASDSGATVAA